MVFGGDSVPLLVPKPKDSRKNRYNNLMSKKTLRAGMQEEYLLERVHLRCVLGIKRVRKLCFFLPQFGQVRQKPRNQSDERHVRT